MTGKRNKRVGKKKRKRFLQGIKGGVKEKRRCKRRCKRKKKKRGCKIKNKKGKDAKSMGDKKSYDRQNQKCRGK